MPTPSQTPNETQIIIVAEITQLDTDTVSTMIAADSTQDMSDAKWALTLTDITTWTTGGVGSDSGDVKRIEGVVEFFEDKAKAGRLDFRNKIRLRYGQSLLDEEYITLSNTAIGGSLCWF